MNIGNEIIMIKKMNNRSRPMAWMSCSNTSPYSIYIAWPERLLLFVSVTLLSHVCNCIMNSILWCIAKLGVFDSSCSYSFIRLCNTLKGIELWNDEMKLLIIIIIIEFNIIRIVSISKYNNIINTTKIWRKKTINYLLL